LPGLLPQPAPSLAAITLDIYDITASPESSMECVFIPTCGRRGSAQRRRNAMTASAFTPIVNLNDHVAAAAYLMKHAGVTALVVLDGQWPGRPTGIITKAANARAVAAGDLGLCLISVRRQDPGEAGNEAL
jgi:hypothetical protein